MKLKQFAYLTFGAVLTTYGTVSLVSNYVDISLKANPQFANLAQNLNSIKNFDTLYSSPALSNNNDNFAKRLPIGSKGEFEVQLNQTTQKIDLMLANHNGSFGVDSDMSKEGVLLSGTINSDNLFPSVLQKIETSEIERLILKDDVDFSKGYKNTYLHLNPAYALPLKLDILALKSEGILDFGQIRLGELTATLDNSTVFMTLGEYNNLPITLTFAGTKNQINVKIPKNLTLNIQETNSSNLTISNTTKSTSQNNVVVLLKLDNLKDSKVNLAN
jgi:hypothetical protein